MTDIATLKAKWKNVVEAAMQGEQITTIGTSNKAWLLDDRHIKVTPKQGGMAEFSIDYPNLGDDSDSVSKHIPQKVAAELRDQGVPLSLIDAHAQEYKDYSWICYGGDVKVVLPVNDETGEMFDRMATTVAAHNPTLLDTEKELETVLKKAKVAYGVKPEQFNEWLEKLPKRLNESLAQESPTRSR